MVGGLGKGVDLNLGSVLLHEDLVELLNGGNGIVDALRREAELGSNRPRDVVRHASVNVNRCCDDGLGAFLGNSLDVHTALRRSDNDGALAGSVHENGQVELSPCELALDDVNRVADASAFAGLLGDELVTNHLVGEDLGLLGTVAG